MWSKLFSRKWTNCLGPQGRIQRGAEGAYAPPKITLKCDKAQATLRNRSKSLELYIA